MSRIQFERTRNTSRIFLFGIINKIVVTLFPFITRTIIIYKLGNDYLGLSTLFTSVLSMLNMSELGIGSAIAFCLYKPVAEDDQETICALMNLMRKLYKLIGFIIIGLGLLLMPFLNIFIKGTYPTDINIYILYLIYLVNSGASYLLFAYKNTLLEVYQRGDVIQKVNTIVELFKYILQIIVLLLFRNYYMFALLLPLAQIAINCLINWRSNKIYPNLAPRGILDKNISNTIRSKVLFLSAQSITSTFTNSIDNIVISSAISLTAVAMYGNYSYISSAVLSVVMIAYSAIKGSVGNIIYTESVQRNKDMFAALRFLSWWAVTICSACMICMYQPFITLWVGSDNLLGFETVVMIVAYFYINASRQFLTMNYIGTAGLWNKTLLRQILITIVNFILDVVLVQRWGIAGIVFASFFSHAMIGLPLDIFVVFKYVLKDNSKTGVFKEFKKFILCSILCAISWLATWAISASGMIALVLGLFSAVLIPNFFIILFYHNTKELKFIIDHLVMLFRHV